MIDFIIKNMVKINLHGHLGKKLGKYWDFEVESVFEIFQAIEANTTKINKYFNDFNKLFTHFVVYIDGKMMPKHLLKSKILKENSVVEIVPVVQGSWFWALIIVGVLLIALSIVLAIILSPKEIEDVKTSSTALSNIRNVLNRNIPVPIGYGRFRIGSAVISNDIIVLSGQDASPSKINSYDLLRNI